MQRQKSEYDFLGSAGNCLDQAAPTLLGSILYCSLAFCVTFTNTDVAFKLLGICHPLIGIFSLSRFFHSYVWGLSSRFFAYAIHSSPFFLSRALFMLMAAASIMAFMNIFCLLCFKGLFS